MKLLDTNILIYLLSKKGVWYELSKDFLTFDVPLAISSLSAFEIIHGSPKSEREEIRNLIDAFLVFDVNREIAYLAGELMADFKKGKNIKIDVLIAATALVHHIPLVTNNGQNFQWIPGLHLEELKDQ